MKTLKTRYLVGEVLAIVGVIVAFVVCILLPAPRGYMVAGIEYLIAILGVMLYVTRRDHKRTDISRSNRMVGRCIIGYLVLCIILLSVAVCLPVQH